MAIVRQTMRQRKLASAIVDNMKRKKPLNKGELLESIGYSPVTAHANPTEIFNGEGLKRALYELGFNSDNAKRVVAEIMNDETVEPNTRLKASELTFKVQGDFAPEKHITIEKHIISIDG